MRIILIGNAVALVGSLVMIGIGFIKRKDHILLAQCAMFLIMGVGNLLLGGVTGFIANMVSLVRNLVVFKWPFTTPLKLLFIAVQVGISLLTHPQGVIAWLPILAACIFTWFLDLKDAKQLKVLIIVTQAMWIVYDLAIKNYVSTAFDVATCASNLYGIYMLSKEKAAEDSAA